MGSAERVPFTGRQPDSAAGSPEERNSLVRAELEKIIVSPGFRNADRMARFLRFVVDRTQEGKLDDLKEYSIGLEVFDRGSSFDPRLDPVVRVEARRLRKKLEEYYEGEGAHARIRIQLPKGGYAVEFEQPAPEKSSAPAAAGTNGTAATATPATSGAAASPASDARTARIAIAAILAMAAVAALSLYWTSRTASRRASSPAPATAQAAIRSVAVLPLQNLTGDPANEYFAAGMTDALITELAQVRALRVISRTSTMKYEGTKKSLPDIGRELHVDAIVEGSVVRSGDHVRITAQLIEAGSDTHIWAQTYDGSFKDILGIQTQVSKAIVREVRVRLTPQEEARLAEVRSVNPEAYEAYLKGLYLLSQRTPAGIEGSLALFQKATRLDPNYAPAYLGLANSYVVAMSHDMMPSAVALAKGRAAAEKALALDDSLGQAYAALAQMKFFHEWDFQGAEREFKMALDRSPNSSTAHHWYGVQLMLEGRFDEADRQMREAQELDPLSLIISAAIALNYVYAGQPDRAIEQANKTLAINGNFPSAYAALGLAYERKKMFPEAIAAYQKYLELSGRDPDAITRLAEGYAAAGNTAEARKLLHELEHPPKGMFVTANNPAAVYAMLGEKDKAFELLDLGLKQRATGMMMIRWDPPFDPLRSDPRFQSLCRKLGFPQ
jgi:TolB-like protein/tetratricopeptide (TPR) repeat protein